MLVVVTDLVNNLVSFCLRHPPLGHVFPWDQLEAALYAAGQHSGHQQCQSAVYLAGQDDSRAGCRQMQVTVYKTPQDITYMIGQLLASIVLVAVPRLAYYSGNGRMQEFMELVDKSYHSFMLIVFPACTGVACLAPEIMWIYGGGENMMPRFRC